MESNECESAEGKEPYAPTVGGGSALRYTLRAEQTEEKNWATVNRRKKICAPIISMIGTDTDMTDSRADTTAAE